METMKVIVLAKRRRAKSANGQTSRSKKQGDGGAAQEPFAPADTTVNIASRNGDLPSGTSPTPSPFQPYRRVNR
jgi:hypothetical protein